MATVTISKKVTKGAELVVIPKETYERFLRLERFEKKAKESVASSIEEGLEDMRKGRMTPAFSSIKEFKRFLKKR